MGAVFKTATPFQGWRLKRILVLAKSTNIKIIDFKADLKNVLEDWLDGWDHGKASDKITVQGQGLVETVPETDENNSLQVKWQVTS